MSGKNIAMLLGGVGLVYWLSAKAFNIKEAITKLSVSNPRIRATFTALTLKLNVNVDIVNPSSADIPFEYYAGTISYAGMEVGKFNYNYQGKAVTLKARSATPLNFIVNVSNIAVLYKLLGVIQQLANNSSAPSVIFDVRSSIYAGGFDVPVNFSYNLKTQSVISGIGISGRRRKVNFVQPPPPSPPPPPVEVVNDEAATENLGYINTYEYAL